MWITKDVDIPRDLIDDIEADRVVIFAGAGVSVAAPSSLPSFLQLAEQIGRESQQDGPNDIETLDAYLGGLVGVVDVNRRVQEIVGRPGSRPNSLHRALAALARCGGTPRLVTTNYDTHLTRSLHRRGAPKHPVYMAPAIPMGDDFEGIVHLHGSLEAPARRLVVTDIDFGHAYLTDAWAARFLYRLFRQFTVLFVGYSHDDAVMRYVARGLPPGTRRFAMDGIDEAIDQAAKWNVLGITPIFYPKGDDQRHTALPAALSRLAEQLSLGSLEKREQVRDALSDPPTSDLIQFDFLQDCLRTPATLPFLLEFARGPRWLKWVTEQPEFADALLRSEATETSHMFVRWFVDNYVVSPEFSDLALWTIQPLQGRLSSHALGTLALSLNVLADANPILFRKWSAVVRDGLDKSAPQRRGLNFLVPPTIKTRDIQAGVHLFESLTRPRLALKRPYFDERHVSVRSGLSFRGDEHWVTQIWTDLLCPNLEHTASQLLVICEHHLSEAFYMARAFATDPDNDWDHIASSRSAIEPHAQNVHGPDRTIDTLIDVARDAIEYCCANATVDSVPINRWAKSNIPILRRLAVHAVRSSPAFPDASKIRWVIEKGLVWDFRAKHEVFTLIAEALPHTSARWKAALLRQVCGRPQPSEHETYIVFNFLTLLVRADPGWVQASRTLSAIGADHPRFAPRDHPDLDSVMTEFTWSGPDEPAITSQALHTLIQEDHVQAFKDLIELPEDDYPEGGATWHGAQVAIRATVQDHPGDGHMLWAETSNHVPENRRNEARAAILEGWSHAELSDGHWALILEVLKPATASLARDTAALLVAGVTDTAHPLPSSLHPKSDALAAELWVHTRNEDSDFEDPLTVALNSLGGVLTRYWLAVVNRLHTDQDGNWTGIPKTYKTRFSKMTDGSGPGAQSARTLFGLNAGFLMAIDERWFQTAALPLFDAAINSINAVDSFTGLLKQGRLNNRLLGLGVLEHLELAIPHLLAAADRLDDDDLRQAIGNNLAAIGVRYEQTPLVHGWLNRISALPDRRPVNLWASAMTQVLGTLSEDEFNLLWDSWFHEYWRNRTGDRPRKLSGEESSAFATWAPFTHAHYPDAVTLILKSEASLDAHADTIRQITEQGHTAAYPHQTVELVAHLLERTSGEFWGGHYLRDLVITLTPLIGRISVEPIIERCLRVGLPEAAKWADEANELHR